MDSLLCLKEALITSDAFQPFISQFFGEPLMAALPYCNLVIGNESEADAFGTAQGMEDKSPVAVAKKIAAWPQEDSTRPRVCIITQGAGHTVVVCEGKLHGIDDE